MKKLIIVGGGSGGVALFEMIFVSEELEISAVVDIDEKSPGRKKAEKKGVPVYSNWKEAVKRHAADVIIDVTGDRQTGESLKSFAQHQQITLIPGAAASILFQLIDEKRALLAKIEDQHAEMENILQSTHDGMIAIDERATVKLMNRRAEEMTDLTFTGAVGLPVNDVIPSSRLKDVLVSETMDANREQTLDNGRKIITTRIPLYKSGILTGALAVFQDITEIKQMAEEVTNLKSIQTMLEAIIQSSDDAISVVDKNGSGLMINPAYTRLTGLSESDVIGKPATADISEGKSMHMHVLETKTSVRGVRMKVGPQKKDVVVNVAPVIVDNEIQGSVGVIHDVSELEALTHELERAKQIIRTLEAQYRFEDIIGESQALKGAIDQAKAAAATPATILVRGESGTGKELFAHAIHNESPRKFYKFIRVNCASLSENLLESELFGYEDGAFSGAKRGGKKGLFEEADKGSIFLDEIGELSAKMQAKLLRVLQEQEIVRVGGTEPVSINVRVIAATNVNIENKISEKMFREDLYYRLNRLPITLPSLRDRIDDLPVLTEYIITKLNQEYGRNVKKLSTGAYEELRRYTWPGNVRELENVLGRAMIHMLYSSRIITEKDIPPLQKRDAEASSAADGLSLDKKTLQEVIRETEKKAILQAIKENDDNKTKAAAQLGISIRSLYYRLEKLT
ncbi:sigma 54-interacting transcriptional regulator [Salisediminibacterium halotolerans]|uniref:PAS domain S-box-containing protein n=1 Tax=Salisediminibacterium halotolerans TaxID=517425 RepID=A0A1H9PEK1_9BACI|nr:sigma 54-interacting transcriptional regulator [Salisediminibacterium haloalkalitolerans]SER46686.1 PAS domain S-box-containing protein [Salisediminibacterium haloalkalitolerans]